MFDDVLMGLVWGLQVVEDPPASEEAAEEETDERRSEESVDRQRGDVPAAVVAGASEIPSSSASLTTSAQLMWVGSLPTPQEEFIRQGTHGR